MTRLEELEQEIDKEVEKFRLEINKFKAEIEQIKALAELKESKKGKWKPNKDEWYWFVTQYGEVKRLYWQDTECYKYLYSRQPIFETKEECERYKLFMDTVKEKSYEFTADEWEDGDIIKYYIYYEYKNGTFDIYSADIGRSFGKIYFKDEESAQYIIDNFKNELMEFFVERRDKK